MTASMLRLAFVTATALITGLCSTASWALPHAPTVALLEAPAAKQDIKEQLKTTSLVTTKHKFAHIAAAAICTEDLATISFQEYAVDWTPWLSQVASTWSQAMNSSCPAGAVKPSGPMFVEFTCNRDGTVKKVLVDRSSGDKLCDAMQVATLLHASPLPAFPVASRKSDITLLCIWSYSKTTNIAKTVKHSERPIIRVSISGGSM